MKLHVQRLGVGEGVLYSVWLKHRDQVRNDNGEMERILYA